MPSFVVTLAGLLIWSGVILTLTTPASPGHDPHPAPDDTVNDIAGAFLSDAQGMDLPGILSVGLQYTQARTAQVGVGPGAWSPSRSILIAQVVGDVRGRPGPSPTPTRIAACPS